MPPQAQAGAAPRAEQQSGGGFLQSALRGLLIFIAVQWGLSYLTGKNKTTTTTTKDPSGNVVKVPANTGDIPPFHSRPDALDEGRTYSRNPQRVAPIWDPTTPVDLTIVVSPSFVREPLLSVPAERFVANEVGFRVGDYSDKRVLDAIVPLPKQVQNNGTLWGHFYIGTTGSKLDPFTEGYDPSQAYHFVWPLTQYLAEKKTVKTKNLLAAVEEVEEPEVEIPTGPVISTHYHPNLTLSFVPDTKVMAYSTLTPPVRQYVHLEPSGARDATGLNGWYYPVLFINTFWQLRSQMQEINSTVVEVPLHIDLNNVSQFMFSILASMDEGSKNAARQAAHGNPVPGGGDGSEFEMLKEILLDSNPYLLATTAVVSVLHMVFEAMAFKSDISHWRNKKDNVGISVRTILGNVFMQTVIFLYLLDNNENTSWMIMVSQGLGIFLELWKVTKTVDIRFRPVEGFIPYRIVFEDKHKLSETEEKTKEYDEIAFKYLYIVAVPLLIAYAIYSLVYETHKSWYSFVLTTLVGSVYAYGFLMMVPSLYINYRLKSVAHMPAKAMTYKFLNTFIDDLFAFTIKMPTLYRLATLRDDVIFFVYIYQSYKYKVDYTRVNEFGQGGDDEEPEEKVANKPLAANPDAAPVDVVDKAIKASGSQTQTATKRK